MVGRVPLVVLGAVALVATGAELGHAQGTDRPGWFTRSNAPAPRTTDDAAARLYADARADLAAGDAASAQRRLELLVAQHPTSPLADVARRDLKTMYEQAFAPAGTAVGVAGLTGPPPVKTPPPIASTAHLLLAMDDLRQKAGDRVFFLADSIELPPRAHTALQAQADWLLRNPGVAVTIEGHADDRGSPDDNMQIARRRAEAVRLRLADLGVDASRLAVAAFGRERPLAECPAAHCAAQNRRVVTVITRASGAVGAEAAKRAAQN